MLWPSGPEPCGAPNPGFKANKQTALCEHGPNPSSTHTCCYTHHEAQPQTHTHRDDVRSAILVPDSIDDHGPLRPCCQLMTRHSVRLEVADQTIVSARHRCKTSLSVYSRTGQNCSPPPVAASCTVEPRSLNVSCRLQVGCSLTWFSVGTTNTSHCSADSQAAGESAPLM